MQYRASLILTLAVVVPVVVVLVVVLGLARPAQSPPAPAEGAAPLAEPGADQSMAAIPAAPRPSGPIAPELTGGGAWINSEPLTLAGLKGKVVLVNFWTYGCYNCQNTLPYIKQWWAKYKEQGLVIVGVHTPEFDSERILENVQAAVPIARIDEPFCRDIDIRRFRGKRNIRARVD